MTDQLLQLVTDTVLRHVTVLTHRSPAMLMVELEVPSDWGFALGIDAYDLVLLATLMDVK
jgi:hypothetical protein